MAVLLMSMGVGNPYIQTTVPGTLTFGWLAFLERTVPEISLNWDLVGMGALCSATVLYLGHRIAAWFMASFARKRGHDWRWQWRWTVCGFIGVGLCFVVGMCVGGIAHQVGWLSSQTERWYERKTIIYLDLHQLDGGLQHAILDTGGDVAAVRQALRNPKSGYFAEGGGGSLLPERFQVLLITDSTNKVVGNIIFPRDTSNRNRPQVLYSFGDENERMEIERLPELIKKHGNALLAL